MNEQEMSELAADVVAIVKARREAEAPKFGSFMESVIYAIQNDPRCKDKKGGNR